MVTQTIKVPKHIMDFCNGLLKRKTECPYTEEIPYTFTVKFDYGCEVDIKIINANPPYVDPVLFDDSGFEACVGEPDAETLDGEYMFESDGVEYKVTVEIE